jgi:hypothetical protein
MAGTTHEVDHGRREWWLEAATMAFYVAVVLGAALIVAVEPDVGRLLAIIWGTALGLAIAHVFAYRLAATLVEGGRPSRNSLRLIGAQLVGAVLVGLVPTLAVLLIPVEDPTEAARFSLAAFIGVSAYGIARSTGASRTRSVVFGVVVLVVAVAVALVKYLLAH